MEEDGGGVEVEEVEVEDDDHDIYGDLESDIFGPSAAKRAKTEDPVNSEEYQTLLKENQNLKVRLKKLERENQTYAKNISSLFLTAKNEVDKKNFIIKNLSDKLKNMTKSKSSLSREDTEETLRRCQEALHESQHAVTLDEIRNSLKQISPQYIAGKKKRKHIKFGNMSLYFFSEQVSFQREEPVAFPTTAEKKKVVDEAPQASAISPQPHPSSQQSNAFGDNKSCERTQSEKVAVGVGSNSGAGRTSDNFAQGNDRFGRTRTNSDSDKCLPEAKRDFAPGRRTSCDNDSWSSERNNHPNRHNNNPAAAAPDRERYSQSNRKDNDYATRSRSREYDARSGGDGHSNSNSRGRDGGGGGGHRSNDYRNRRNTRWSNSTNDSKYNDGKRHGVRSRSRSR